MNKRKTLMRTLSVILVLATLLGAFAICASAASTARLAVNASNGSVKITVNGAVKHTGGTVTIDVEKGAEVTITAVDGTYLFLTDGIGNTCTEESSYTFTMRGAATYTAWFEETAGSAVIYKNSNTTAQVLASATYTSADSFTAHLKDSAIKYGYEFHSWSLTVDQIKAKIASGEKTIIVTPVYDTPEKTHTVIVEGGKILQTGTTREEVPYMEKVTLVAEEASSGLYFLGWKNSAGDIISTSRYVILQVFENDIYTAEFSAHDQAYPSQISIALTPADNQVVKSNAQFLVGRGMTLVSYGLLYVKNSSYNMDDMVIDNVDGTTLKMASYNTPGGILVNTFVNCNSVYARAFLIYTDGETEYTVYSNPQYAKPASDDYQDDPFAEEPFIGDTGDDTVGDYFGENMTWTPAHSSPSSTYNCAGGATLSTYNYKTEADYASACNYYLDQGYKLYKEGSNVAGVFRASTYTKNNQLAHIYWNAHDKAINIVTSNIEGLTLPPSTPAVTSGSYSTSVTQLTAKYGYLNSDKSDSFNSVASGNGMGYVIQLADGSFIVYDGGYDDDAKEVWETLKSLNNNSESGIIIRAWLISHGHGDHYPAFNSFVEQYGSKVTMEYLLIAPVNPSISGASKVLLNDVVPAAQGAGMRVCYLHTGMKLTFCDMDIEVLFAAEEVYKKGTPQTTHDFYLDTSHGLIASGYDNESSMVTRFIKNGGKSMVFTGDTGIAGSDRMLELFGKSYLKSDICQVSHHGCESFGIETYKAINADIWMYPCSTTLYNTNRDSRNSAVIKALAGLGTKHIVRTTKETVTRAAADGKVGIVSVTANANNKQLF